MLIRILRLRLLRVELHCRMAAHTEGSQRRRWAVVVAVEVGRVIRGLGGCSGDIIVMRHSILRRRRVLYRLEAWRSMLDIMPLPRRLLRSRIVARAVLVASTSRTQLCKLS